MRMMYHWAVAGLLVLSLTGSVVAGDEGEVCAVESRSAQKTESAMLFLRIVNSPRAVGMGGAVVNQVDGEAGLYNPGALGVFQLRTHAAVNIPIETKWLQDLNDRLRLSTFSGSIGQVIQLDDEEAGVAPRLALTFGYSRMKLDYNTGPRGFPGEVGFAPGDDFVDEADCFTVALGLDYYARIGFGFTHKRLRSPVSPYGGTARATAHDLGVLLEIPLTELIKSRSNENQTFGSKTSFECTPSFAHVLANRGGEIDFPDAAFNDPLPKIRRSGFALKLGVKQGRASYASIVAVHEIEKNLVGDMPDITKTGVELGILGALFIRGGYLDDDGGETSISTMGFGVSLAGGLAWVIQLNKLHGQSPMTRRIIENLDLAFDMGWYDHHNEALLRGTKFYRIRFSI